MHKPNGSFAKKVFAAGLAISTALWASAGLFVFVAQAVEAHPAGTLVLSGGTVWQVTADGAGRQGIDTLAKFNSHRFSFANVVPANSADLALPDQGLLGLGSGVLFNDGGTVFQVAGGQKHGFTSAANFTGNGFSFANVVAGDVSGVSAGANIDSTSAAHLEGTFVNSGGTVHMITATGRKGVPSPGVLYSYGATFADVVAANSADLALSDEGNATFRTGALVNDSGTVYAVTSTTRRGFPTASCFTGFGFSFSQLVSGSTSGLTAGASYCADSSTPPATPPSASTGSLTMALSPNTPAANTAVKNAARFGFLTVDFTASGGDVTIDALKVERTGISNDSNFTDIILLDVSNGKAVGQAKQLGNEKSLGSTHTATFGDNITVASGTTKSLMVAANMAGTLQNGDVAKLELTEVTLTGSATKVGSLPIAGNGMSMNNNVAIATVTVAAGGQNPAASTQNVGAADYVVSSFKVTAGSQEDVEVSSVRFFQNGTAADSDVSDLELVVDGSVVATVANPTDKVVDFVLSSPILINKGNNKDFNLRLDIADGSARTISMDIDKKADVVAKGLTYGYFRVPSYPNTSSPFFNANDTTIDKGSLTFSKGVVSSLNVAEGSSNQPLGAFKATVQGEAVSVTQFVLGVNVAGATGDIGDVTNLTVKDEDGNVVAGPIDPDTTVTTRDTATSTDTVIFPVGTKTYTVYGDLNSDFTANDTIQIDLPDPDGLTTAKGAVTNQTITAGPTTDLSLDTVTVKAGTLLVSTAATPGAQSVIVGQSQFTFANIILSASNSGEDVRVTQFALVHKTGDDSDREDHIANLTLYDGSTALSPIVQPTNVASATTATSTFSLTNPIVVAKGASKTITVKGDIIGGAENDWHSFGCTGGCITATGATTANTIAANITNSDGQRMTIAGSGTLTIAAAASSPQQGKLVVGGASKVTVGEILLTATNEDLDLSEIHFAASAVNGGELNDEFATVYLFDGSTQVASQVPTTTAAITFTSLEGNFRVPKGSSGKVLTVKVDTNTVTNLGGDGNIGDSGDGVNFTVAEDAYTAKGVSSGSKLAATATSGTFSGQQFSIYKSVPTWEKINLTNALINTSGVPLFKFKVTADAKGDIGLYKFSFAISTSSATITAYELFEEPDTSNQVNLTNNGTRSSTECLIAGVDGKNSECVIDVLFDTGTDGVGNGGEFRQLAAGASKVYEFRGTVANSTTNSSVTVKLRGDNAFTTTSPGYPDCGGGATGANSCSGINGAEQGNFVWSDLFYGNSSSTATNTAQWFNGFRVPGLTTTSSAQTLTP